MLADLKGGGSEETRGAEGGEAMGQRGEYSSAMPANRLHGRDSHATDQCMRTWPAMMARGLFRCRTTRRPLESRPVHLPETSSLLPASTTVTVLPTSA